MRLDQLSVYPNPWMEPTDRDAGSQTQRVSPTTVRSAMPTLTECCLRQLLAPAMETSQKEPQDPETVLEALYGSPLTGTERIAPRLLEMLRACVPRAVAAPDAIIPSKRPRLQGVRDVHASSGAAQQRLTHPRAPDMETHPGVGVCPALDHRRAQAPVYVQWAEERFTWECVVAGKSVSSLGGPGVPVRWRGCERGCLDFLDAEEKVGGGVDVDTDVDMGDQSGDDVQVLDLGSGGLADSDVEEFD